MQTHEVFALGLGLVKPWFVLEVKFTPGINPLVGQVDITIGFERGSRFPDDTQALCPVHDTVRRTWQHMNFFQHKCLVHCNVPRIRTTSGQTLQVEVPWAAPSSGFTLLFEAMAMLLVENEMPVNKAARMVSIHPNRLWRIVKYWVGNALGKQNLNHVRRIGMDETSTRKRHKYMTVSVDLDDRSVIAVERGKGTQAVEDTVQYLENKGCKAQRITDISIDLSPAYIAGASIHFPNAEVTFDKFHIVKLLNESMDVLRKAEQFHHAELKKSRYLWLKNDSNLSTEQLKSRTMLSEAYPVLGYGYRLKTLFAHFWQITHRPDAEEFLTNWCREALNSGLRPFQKFVKTLQRHWHGILNYIDTHINNGILEGINSKIQLAKRRARGFRNFDHFRAIVFIVAGKLKFDYPQLMA
jgi:transposase